MRGQGVDVSAMDPIFSCIKVSNKQQVSFRFREFITNILDLALMSLI